ncbi:MAG: 8-oxo-dGTP diphosphatase [Candidatus Sericytochromatia bacterium]|nr:8-oxo-dGTP diphosphatase [Candidatus Sericytochromatia bacterium]
MTYSPIVATLGYVVTTDRQSVLMVHRNARANDTHQGKWNGLGGKLEPSESIAQCMCREVREEANLNVTRMRLRGTINWTGFGRGGEPWFGFIFLIEGYTGEPLTSNTEGELAWQPLARLLSGELPMWEGDKHFLPLVFDEDPRVFYGAMPYENGRPINWSFDRF